MQRVVTITRQGQVTIPKSLREELEIVEQTKASIRKEGAVLVITPRADFKSLSGSLASPISLSDEELRQAREEFGRQWPGHG